MEMLPPFDRSINEGRLFRTSIHLLWETRAMWNRLGRFLVFQALLAVLVSVGACNKSKKNANNAVSQGPNNFGGAPEGMPGGQWPGGPGGPGGPRGPIGEIMAKLTNGPQSLTNIIGAELNEPTPPWDKIQPQTKEYAQLASSMSKYDPPKGEKDTWLKLTGAFTQSANDLEHAAEAKDTDAARAAHRSLRNSCQTCHDAHRRGRGGMGMPPGGFRGPRGPGGPPRQPQ
jgi:hypothetical protein